MNPWTIIGWIALALIGLWFLSFFVGFFVGLSG